MSGIILALVISIIINIKLYFDSIDSRKKRELLESLATIDHVTKVNNKYKLEMILEEQIFIAKRYDRHLSIIQFSIDDLTEIRIKNGTNVYEEILKEIVQLVSKEIRLSDVLGRWSEQQFTILLPETSMIHAVMLAEKLRQKIEAHSFAKVDKITASFGISIMNDKDQIQTLVERVDHALFKAKESGVNKIEVI